MIKKYIQNVGIAAGLAAVLIASSVRANPFEERILRCKNPSPGDPFTSNLSLEELTALTREADGYQGIEVNETIGYTGKDLPRKKKDGKLSGDEVAYHFVDQLYKQNPSLLEPRAGSQGSGFGDNFRIRGREIVLGSSAYSFLDRYDTNGDGYVTSKDDLDQDGKLTCEDIAKSPTKPTKLTPEVLRSNDPSAYTAVCSTVTQSELPVVLLVSSPGGNAKMIDSFEERLAGLSPAYVGKVRFYHGNYQELDHTEFEACLPTAGQMEVYPNPEILFLRSGTVVGRYQGKVPTERALKAQIERVF